MKIKAIISLILIIVLIPTFSGCIANGKLPEAPKACENESETPESAINESDYEEYFSTLEDQNRRVSFLCAGDDVIHPGIYMDAKKRATSTSRAYNFQPIYEDVIDYVKSFDAAFINQETLMAGDEEFGLSGYPCFNSPQDLGYELIDMGFDIVNIANNHMLDKGASGLSATLDFYDTLPIFMIGGYRNEEDYNTVRVYEVGGFKIAMLSYTYSTNGITLSSKSDLAIPYLHDQSSGNYNDETVRRQIRAAKEVSDLVFVSVHWGVENTTKLDSEQKHFSELMAEENVDVIIGHHPHVIQPIEWLGRPDGKRTLCIYSLGNLVSEMEYSMNMIGGFVTFDIVVKNGSAPYIDNVKFTPTLFYYNSSWSNKLYFLEDYSEALASSHWTKKFGSDESHTFTYERSKQFVRDVIDEEFLPDWIK